MVQFIELGEKDLGDYNGFIAARPLGSFLQSWEWGQWQQRLGRQVFRYKIVSDSGWLGTLQLIETALPGRHSYLYAPYGPVTEQPTDLSILAEWVQKSFPRTAFVRLEPQDPGALAAAGELAVKTVNIQPAITMVVNVSLPPEQMLARMHPKTRYNIKLAQRHGVTVQSDLVVTPGHGLYVGEALDLILQTQQRQNYRGHSRQYYHKLIDFFAAQNQVGAVKLRIYKALLNRQLLATGVMIDFGLTRTYLYGGSSDSYREVMAPYLLHYQAMLDSAALGLSRYDLGGSEVASGGEKGFTRFKKGFGGEVINFAGAYDVILDPVYYRLYGVLRRINRIRQAVGFRIASMLGAKTS